MMDGDNILQFRIPKKICKSPLGGSNFLMISFIDLLVFIANARIGNPKRSEQVIDIPLVSQLLSYASIHFKSSNPDLPIILSKEASDAIAIRYPEIFR